MGARGAKSPACDARACKLNARPTTHGAAHGCLAAALHRLLNRSARLLDSTAQRGAVRTSYTRLRISMKRMASPSNLMSGTSYLGVGWGVPKGGWGGLPKGGWGRSRLPKGPLT